MMTREKKDDEKNTRKKDNDIDNEEITMTVQRFVNVKLFLDTVKCYWKNSPYFNYEEYYIIFGQYIRSIFIHTKSFSLNSSVIINDIIKTIKL